MGSSLWGGSCVEGHTIYVYDRGGYTRVAQILDVSLVQWARDRDNVSEATIRIEGRACSEQADMLAAIEPMRSEIVIFRGAERVWEGPVWRVGWHPDYVEITAHDCFAYVLATPMSVAYSSAYPAIETVTARIARIMAAEMGPWEALSPPANVLPHFVAHAFPGEARTTAVTKAFEMTVGEHIQNYGRSGGIDWTVVGRALHVWDVSRWLGRTRTITEADFFGGIILTAYGADHASQVYVIGEDGKYGHAGAPDSYYGLWTKIFTNYNEEGTTLPTQSELDSQAERNLLGRTPVPVEVRVPDNSSIRLSDTLTIDMLVPGVQMPLLATLNARTMSQMQKLDNMTVREDGAGETISVTLMPATRPDVEEEEG